MDEKSSFDQKIHSIIEAFRLIGYTSNLIQRDYTYTDFSSSNPTDRKVAIGIFGQEPLNYRSACFAIHFPRENEDTNLLARTLRSFGAPQNFFILNGKTERWINAEKGPAYKETISTNALANVIESQKSEWNPDSIIRLKTGTAKVSDRQLDFVDVGLLPALEHEASEKIDFLIKNVIEIMRHYSKTTRRNIRDDVVFDLIFRLLTAKLLRDRPDAKKMTIDFSRPDETLKEVSKYYGNKFDDNLHSLPQSLLKEIASEIGGSFSFKNLSVDTLTYVYENTLVSPENRKKLGIHSTPSFVADYLLAQLPIEELRRSKWVVADPMCGHGIFLIAAMRRLRDLLPKDWGGRKRHQFFSNHLLGTDIDRFAIQVAQMCLTLADFPESDGWKLTCNNVFDGENIDKLATRATILVGNPPFEVQRVSGHDIPKPALLLQRVLPKMRPGSLLGLVLPRAFLEGSDYRKERTTMLKDYDLLTITTLPDRIFKYADSETAVVVARRQEKQKPIITVYREVRDQERKEFQRSSRVTWEDKVSTSYFVEKMNGRLVVPFLREIWDTLLELELSSLDHFADINIGVQYEPQQVADRLGEFIKISPFEGFHPAIAKVTTSFRQFIAGETVYIATDKKLRRKRALGAWDLDWSRPKVVVPAGRMSRNAWRYAAAVDRKSRIVTRDFFAIWPKTNNISVETIAAFLNSPLAQAYVFGFSSQRGIPKRVYEKIPIPEITEYQDYSISSLVQDYIELLNAQSGEAKNILQRLDAEILKLYSLPPRLERKLLDVFWGKQRPVPFEFLGYIPPDFVSWIPLHLYLSHGYKESTPTKLFERIPRIDPDFIEYLKTIGTEE